MRQISVIILVLCLAVPGALAAKPSPEKQIEIFFDSLRKAGSDGAIKFLTADTLLFAQKSALLSNTRVQFDAAMAIYGSPTRYEISRTDQLSASLIRISLISFHDNGMPLFWSFTFLKNRDQWEALAFSFNDEFTKVFPLN